MKKFKQITSLVLAFLMVATSISWNGLQVQANDSTETVTTYYFDQTFEEGYEAIGTFTEEGLTTTDFTSDSNAKAITSISGLASVWNLSEAITSDMTDTVYVEMDIIGGSTSNAVPKIQFFAGSKALWNTNTSGNAFRLQDGSNTTLFSIKSNTTHKVKLVLHLDTSAVDYYVMDENGNWPSEANATVGSLAPDSVSSFKFSFTGSDGRDLILDNLKVYTITEVTGGGESGDGDDTGSNTETVYFDQTFEEGYEGIGTIFSDATVTAENDSSLGQNALKITASANDTLNGSLSEVITADTADVVYIEMEVSAGNPVAAFGGLQFTFRDANYDDTATLWTTNSAGTKFKMASEDWLRFTAGEFLKIGMKLTFNTAAEGEEANGTCEFSQIDAEGNWGAVEKTVSGLSITSFSRMRFKFAGVIADRNFFLDNLKVYTITEGGTGGEEPEEPTDVVVVNGNEFGTFAEAYAAAEGNQEIKLYKDVTDEDLNIILSDGVTIDLNGHTLEAGYLVAFAGTKVVDNSTANTGLLKLSSGNLILDKDNGQIPVLDSDGYRFATANMKEAGKMVDNTATSKYIYLGMEPTFKEKITTLFEDGSDDNCVKFGVRLSWTKDDTTHVQDCYFKNDFVKRAYADLDANDVPVGENEYVIMSIKVSNLDDFDGIKAYPFVASSNLGVECVHDTGFEVQDPVGTVE